MYNIKSKIIGLDTLSFNILNELCLRCSYIKLGFGVPKIRKYLINPNIGILYTGLLSYVIAIFHKYNIEYMIQDKREKPIKKYNFNIVNGFTPRDYQQRLISAAITKKRCVIQSATGSGKTFTLANIIKAFGVNTLVVAPKASLSIQIRNEFQEFFGIKVGLINGTEIDIGTNKYYPIIVGTPQTLINHPEILNWAEAVMCDEGHNIPAHTIFSLISQTKNAYYRVAVSATPWRDDGCDLLIDALFAPRKPSDTVTASELIDKGVLVPVNINFIRCQSNCDWQGDYASTYDTAIVNNEYRNNIIVNKAKLHFDKNEPTVILISKMKHGLKLLNMLNEQIDNKSFNINYQNKIYKVHTIEFLSGKDDIDTREAVFQSIRQGKTKICIGSTILDEGIDIKPLQCLIMAQGGCSSTRLFQRVGRVLRTSPGKEAATVYDFIDSNPTLNNHSQIRLNLMRMEPCWNINFIEEE